MLVDLWRNFFKSVIIACIRYRFVKSMFFNGLLTKTVIKSLIILCLRYNSRHVLPDKFVKNFGLWRYWMKHAKNNPLNYLQHKDSNTRLTFNRIKEIRRVINGNFVQRVFHLVRYKLVLDWPFPALHVLSYQDLFPSLRKWSLRGN